MSILNIKNIRELIQNFELKSLFIEELGWNHLSMKSIPYPEFTQLPIAGLGSIPVFAIVSSQGQLPEAKLRATIHRQISQTYHENLLIFLDKQSQPTQSVWRWVKREEGQEMAREHVYLRGQSGDLFISKLSGLFVDLSELDESGNVSVLDVLRRLQKSLDVEPVTKKFYRDFEQQHLAFLELITGIKDDRDRRWYASVLLNRLMFIWFLQIKHFLANGNDRYLQEKLAASSQRGQDRYFADFLPLLFFQGFAKPPAEREDPQGWLGEIPYLNGGLFLKHRIELENPHIVIPDKAFANLFGLFQKYTWSLDDSPGGDDNEINPDVLGYIFEKYINQKQFGAYYTRPEITEYLCTQTIYQLILDKVNHPEVPSVLPARRFETVPELLIQLDAPLCRELLWKVLPELKLLDPACGSGAFLVAAMKVLINLYSAVIGKIKFLHEASLTAWLKQTEEAHPSLSYFIKKQIIVKNLFGVDIMEEATEIAKLRLFLALVSSANTVEHLEPLPNIDFNILAGNSLIGLLTVDGEKFAEINKTGDLFKDLAVKSYQQILAEKNRLIASYRDATGYAAKHLQSLRDEIYAHKRGSQRVLNQLLLKEFERLKIRFEQATWDSSKQKEGKPVKRPLTVQDLESLHPFHWGYEFDEVLRPSSPALLPEGEGSSPRPLGEGLGVRGGFDAIITNPPWETFQPNGKEFFSEYSESVSKKKMDIKDYDAELKRLLVDEVVKTAWLTYQSNFNHQREFFRFANQYKHQVPLIDGKRHGKDVNLYKLFLEQCFNLLRDGGQCGMVIPSGIYTDLGATGLRELLFEKTQVTGLFGFENRQEIFEGVHRSFKFVVLTLAKGPCTESFPAAFMRHEVKELQHFPQSGALWLTTELIRRLSPDSHSVMEFKSEKDIAIAEKMLKFPLLGKQLERVWNLELHREFNMTDDAYLLHKERPKNGLPLYEGKMIHQFDHRWGEPKYWIDEQEGRKALLGKKEEDKGQVLEYQGYRLAYRSIASSTNERALICTVIPPCFTGNSLNISENFGIGALLVCVSFLNSFVVDWLLRQKVTTNINMFYIYQLPVPRLTAQDPPFKPIVTRAAQLICTTPEYDDLAKEVADLAGLRDLRGLTDSQQRTQVRAELDGMIAHLYGLTEEEFRHILGTFPLVKEEVKEAAVGAYLTFFQEFKAKL